MVRKSGCRPFPQGSARHFHPLWSPDLSLLVLAALTVWTPSMPVCGCRSRGGSLESCGTRRAPAVSRDRLLAGGAAGGAVAREPPADARPQLAPLRHPRAHRGAPAGRQCCCGTCVREQPATRRPRWSSVGSAGAAAARAGACRRCGGCSCTCTLHCCAWPRAWGAARTPLAHTGLAPPHAPAGDGRAHWPRAACAGRAAAIQHHADHRPAPHTTARRRPRPACCTKHVPPRRCRHRPRHHLLSPRCRSPLPFAPARLARVGVALPRHALFFSRRSFACPRPRSCRPPQCCRPPAHPGRAPR